MPKGKGIPMHHRDQVRPFARELGDLLERFHGRVFDLDREGLLRLQEAVDATLAVTSAHGKGAFHNTATFLRPFIRDAIEMKNEEEGWRVI